MYIDTTTMQNSAELLRKLYVEQPYGPEILLLSIYWEISHLKNTCTPVFSENSFKANMEITNVHQQMNEEGVMLVLTQWKAIQT